MTKQTERALPATSSAKRSVDTWLLWAYVLAGLVLALDLFVWRPL